MVGMGKKFWVTLEYFLLLLVPTVIMQDVRILAYRPLIMGMTLVYILLVASREHYSLDALGLTFQGFRPALRRIFPWSLLLVIGMTLVVYLLPRQVVLPLLGQDGLSFPLTVRLALYIFTSVPVQEVIYRSYLMLRLETLGFPARVTNVLGVLAFTLGHVPFQSPLMLAVAALLGILYVWSYRQNQNLLALCISHAFVGASLMVVRNSLIPF